jgi:predicted  nucleic acid-binding Zn-ribbon protein
MQNEQVAAFIELIELDQRLGRLARQHSEEANKKNALLNDLDLLEKEIVQADFNVRELQKKIHALELDLKTIDRSLVRTQEKSVRAQSQREIDSLDHEKNDLEDKRAALDEQGLGLIDELEKATSHTSVIRTQAQEIRQKKMHELDVLNDQIHRLEISIENCTAYQTQLSKHAAQDYLSTYKAMKKNVSNPAVPVVKESCSGCFYPLTPSLLHTLEQTQLGTCKSCYRTLYITHKEPDVIS